jgi:putative phosphonate metabolism protein
MNKATPARRYALYFAPAASTPLDDLGRTWLGRDARTGEPLEPVLPPSIDRATWLAATEDPRRYGFHATLKPPFRLADGCTDAMLRSQLETFSAAQGAFPLPRLRVGKLGRFLALVLPEPAEALFALAGECVTAFDPLRAHPAPEDLARRMSATHTAAERENLLRWGYPYVLNTWKFHMTLTSSLAPELLTIFHEHLQERCSEVCAQPLQCDAICLFEEPAPNAPFLLVERYPLSA